MAYRQGLCRRLSAPVTSAELQSVVDVRYPTGGGGVADPQRPPAAASGPGAVILYWHVEDVQGMFGRMLALGATKHGRPQDRGQRFVTASVVDPFGNLLRFMWHYVEILAAKG